MRPKKYRFDSKTKRYHQAAKKLAHFLDKYFYLLIASLSIMVFFCLPLYDWDGQYSDSDGYMRALRLYHLILSPSFFEQPIPESNYPFGEIIHWTRPLDILWLALYLPIKLLTALSIKDSLFISGLYLSPILGILSLIVLSAGLKRHFNIYLVFFGCQIILCNFGIISIFEADRPDHHSLMVLLALCTVSTTLCWQKKHHPRYLTFLGLALALATMTAAVEGFILYTLFMGYFVISYIFKNISPVYLKKISLTFAATLTICLALNPPYQGWFYLDTGRLSFFYIIISWLIALSFNALTGLALTKRPQKISALVIIAVIIIASTLIICSLMPVKPFFDEEIKKIFISRISEMRPITNTLPTLAVARFLFPLTALIVNFYMLKNRHYQRLMILNLTLGLPLFILTLCAVRFSHYTPLYIILPFLALIDQTYRRSNFYKNKSKEFPGSVWAIIYLVIFIELTAPFPHSIYRMVHPVWNKHENSIPLYSHIRQIGGTLATDIFRAPIYVYNCDVNTLGTAYHGNIEGILDNHALFYATADNEIIPLILKHQITQILMVDYEQKYYSLKEKDKDKLYYRLIKRENIPDFLEEVPTNQQKARLYKTKI